MGRYPYLGRFDRLSAGDHGAVERALTLTDTASLAQSPVDTLSGGDLQRLTLAQALAQEPAVLLLDEPTSHLDLNHQLQVLDLVRLRTAEGLAVLGVFHDIGLAARYADRLAVVAHGRLRALGRPHDVVTSELLHEVFGVRAVVGTDPVTGTVNVTPVLRDEGQAPARRERVFVLAGSGAGAAIMRDLVQAGYEVVAGALNEGDIDQAVADALGIAHVKLPAFGEMDEAAEGRVRSLVAESSVAVVSEVPFGGANVGNLRAVADTRVRAILIGDVVGRDFTQGRATDLTEKLVAAGALRIARSHELLGALEAAVTTEGQG
jgi:iron complex transport system ATP-binding protein